MIFVTVGAQMSFDRMIEWVDEWAIAEGRNDVVAQIGPSDFEPRAVKVLPFMAPPEFRERMASADAIIAHAGMGSILNALELAKPIVVIPRLSRLGETRNEHQVGTAKRLSEEGLVLTADTPERLAEQMRALAGRSALQPIGAHAQDSLLTRLRDFAES